MQPSRAFEGQGRSLETTIHTPAIPPATPSSSRKVLVTGSSSSSCMEDPSSNLSNHAPVVAPLLLVAVQKVIQFLYFPFMHPISPDPPSSKPTPPMTPNKLLLALSDMHIVTSVTHSSGFILRPGMGSRSTAWTKLSRILTLQRCPGIRH